MRYIFFGSSEFAKLVLKGLIDNDFRPLLVVAPERKPKGRKKVLSPTSVEELAILKKIEVMTPPDLNDENFLNKIKELNVDFALLTAYGKIIPKNLLTLFEKGFLNLHPSLLPKLRGATPIQSAILNNEKETGVTLFLMDEKIDHGPIIKNKKYTIQDKKITYTELMQELAILGVKLVIETIPQWLEGRINPSPQDDSLATYCHKITKEDEKINWSLTSEEIERKIRALNPTYETYTILKNKVYKILEGESIDDNENSLNKKIGEIFELNGKMAVKCGKGFLLINLLRPEGKKTMKADDFIKGNKKIIGEIFE